MPTSINTRNNLLMKFQIVCRLVSNKMLYKIYFLNILNSFSEILNICSNIQNKLTYLPMPNQNGIVFTELIAINYILPTII